MNQSPCLEAAHTEVKAGKARRKGRKRGTSIVHRELRKKRFFLRPEGLPGMGDLS